MKTTCLALALTVLAPLTAQAYGPIVVMPHPLPPERSDVLGHSLYHAFGGGWRGEHDSYAFTVGFSAHALPWLAPNLGDPLTTSAVAGGLDMRLRFRVAGNFGLGVGASGAFGAAPEQGAKAGLVAAEVNGGWTWWLGTEADAQLDLVVQAGFYGVSGLSTGVQPWVVAGARLTLETWVDRLVSLGLAVTTLGGTTVDVAASLAITYHSSSYDGTQ